LLERNQTQQKLKEVLSACIQCKTQVSKMEDNVLALENRAMEMDATLRRAVGAKAMIDSQSLASLGLSIEPQDPLLEKFRDRGIDV
jgi:acetyl-CoA carboxylase beta subunit